MSNNQGLNYEQVPAGLRNTILGLRNNPGGNGANFEENLLYYLKRIADKVAVDEARTSVVIQMTAVLGEQVTIQIPHTWNYILSSVYSGGVGLYFGGLVSAQPDITVGGGSGEPTPLLLPLMNQGAVSIVNLNAAVALGTIHFCRL